MMRASKACGTLLLAAALAACASAGDERIRDLTPAGAAAMLVAGRTTSTDVRRELGEATVTAFPDGRAVWVYTLSDSPARLLGHVPVVGRFAGKGIPVRELKILFDRDGTVRKYRLQEIRLQ